MFRKIIKTKNERHWFSSRQGGMTYVELIVVLSIFSIMSSIILFNYGTFQAKVDIKNLASDIALKIVEAQKSAMSGKLHTTSIIGWKPAYGVYFDPSPLGDTSDSGIPFNKKFIYFGDFVDNNQMYDSGTGCSTAGGECLDNIHITKNNYISSIIPYIGNIPQTPITVPLSTTFTRPNSNAVFSVGSGPISGFDYMQINISSPQGVSSKIKIYPSGRIQTN